MPERRTFKILILEDSPELRQMFGVGLQRRLQGKPYEAVFASRVTEALNILSVQSDIDIIVVDGQLEDDDLGTTFARAARQAPYSYTGPMLAASSSEDMNALLQEAGCDHVARRKEAVPACIAQILDRPQA